MDVVGQTKKSIHNQLRMNPLVYVLFVLYRYIKNYLKKKEVKKFLFTYLKKERKNKNINHGSIKPSRDLLKNEKEESYVNTTE